MTRMAMIGNEVRIFSHTWEQKSFLSVSDNRNLKLIRRWTKLVQPFVLHDLCPPVKSPERNASVSSGETGDMHCLPAELLSGNYAFTGQQNLCCIIQVRRKLPQNS